MQVQRALEESLLDTQQTQMPLTQPAADEDPNSPAGLPKDDDFPRLKAVSGKKHIYDRGIFCQVAGGCKFPAINETWTCRHSGCERQIHHVCYSDFVAVRARRGEFLNVEEQHCKYHKPV